VAGAAFIMGQSISTSLMESPMEDPVVISLMNETFRLEEEWKSRNNLLL